VMSRFSRRQSRRVVLGSIFTLCFFLLTVKETATAPGIVFLIACSLFFKFESSSAEADLEPATSAALATPICVRKLLRVIEPFFGFLSSSVSSSRERSLSLMSSPSPDRKIQLRQLTTPTVNSSAIHKVLDRIDINCKLIPFKQQWLALHDDFLGASVP